MRGNQKVLASALAFLFLAIAFSSFQLLGFTVVRANTPKPSPISLTVVGINGTKVVLNENDIAALPSYRAYGGYKNQLGYLKGLGNYTGVSLSVICGLVADLTNASVVKIIAEDNYSMTFTFAEVNGEFVTYDTVSGAEVPHSQPLVPIIAYYFNDANLTSFDGPLRLAIVGPEGLATDSKYWVKQVVRVEVFDETVPEFPSLTVLSLLLLVTSATAVILKAFRQSPSSVRGFREL